MRFSLFLRERASVFILLMAVFFLVIILCNGSKWIRFNFKTLTAYCDFGIFSSSKSKSLSVQGNGELPGKNDSVVFYTHLDFECLKTSFLDGHEQDKRKNREERYCHSCILFNCKFLFCLSKNDYRSAWLKIEKGENGTSVSAPGLDIQVDDEGTVVNHDGENINNNGETIMVNGNGQDLSVNGNRNTVSITGPIDNLNLNGNENDIVASGSVAHVNLLDNDNMLTLV